MTTPLTPIIPLTGLIGTTVVLGVGLKSIELIDIQAKNIIKPTKLKISKVGL